MASGSQSASGKSWEYGLARAAADTFSVPLFSDKALNTAQKAYERLDEQERMRIDTAASEAIVFLSEHDDVLEHAARVSIQSDMKGQSGDVRDVIVHTTNDKEIGISAKHRHGAIKHSRLSPKINFGQKWYGKDCSEQYTRSVAPIWKRLQADRDEGKAWRDIPDKDLVVYSPIIQAFMVEVRTAPAEKLLRYMLGIDDYYKVMKENGNVLLQSFNLAGNLGWGQKMSMPSRIIDVEQRRSSTAVIVFDEGWTLSFRLHNAESKVTPSLKFDVTLISTPLQANHTIKYR